MTEAVPQHVPVLPSQVIEFLADVSADTPRPSPDSAQVSSSAAQASSGPADACSGLIVDCTLGLGGHSSLLLDCLSDSRLIGLDRDVSNIELARRHLEPYGDRVRLVHADFGDLASVLRDLNEPGADIVLADLGLSSNQIANGSRGFSFEIDGPLDMRMDPAESRTAEELVNSMPESELADLLYIQSGERSSRRISRRICEARRFGRIRGTVELARIVMSAVGATGALRRSRIHPATRTFMALRMAVNRETEALQSLLSTAPDVLRPGGRLAIISFHSVEDRLVKHAFRAGARAAIYRILTRRPVVADDLERHDNPRSRSAKLRVVERLESSL